jgi:hypothetical protein
MRIPHYLERPARAVECATSQFFGIGMGIACVVVGCRPLLQLRRRVRPDLEPIAYSAPGERFLDGYQSVRGAFGFRTARGHQTS